MVIAIMIAIHFFKQGLIANDGQYLADLLEFGL